MTLDIPQPIAAYLMAENAQDARALSDCFIEDGMVHDEGRDYVGSDAIREWKQAADARFRYVLEPIDAQANADKVTVRASITGDFPGSPVVLNLTFKLSANKIASLEIWS